MKEFLFQFDCYFIQLNGFNQTTDLKSNLFENLNRVSSMHVFYEPSGHRAAGAGSVYRSLLMVV